MPAATPDRVLDKFTRLHTRLAGVDAIVKFILYDNTDITDPYAEPSEITLDPTETDVDPQPVIKDQPDEDLAPAFGGGIGADERLFQFVTDSFVNRVPLDTLKSRAEAFLYARTGDARKGGILYGDELYIIKRFFARPILGSIPARYVVLAVRNKSS